MNSRGLLLAAAGAAVLCLGACVSVPAGQGDALACPTKEQGPSRYWLLKRGPIHQQMQDWADEAGWKLVWGVPVEVTVANDHWFSGDYATVIREAPAVLANDNAWPPVSITYSLEAHEIRVDLRPGVTMRQAEIPADASQ